MKIRARNSDASEKMATWRAIMIALRRNSSLDVQTAENIHYVDWANIPATRSYDDVEKNIAVDVIHDN